MRLLKNLFLLSIIVFVPGNKALGYPTIPDWKINSFTQTSFYSDNGMAINQAGGTKTAIHAQSQLDILHEQGNYIDRAIAIIQEAKKKNHHVKISEIPLRKVFEGGNVEAIAKWEDNGLAYFFNTEEVKPRPWGKLVGLAFVAAIQVGIGAVMASFSGNAALIYEGVGDMITAVKGAITGTFSWASWAMQKAISLGANLISWGVGGIKNGFQTIKNTTKDLLGKTSINMVKDGAKNATRHLVTALSNGVVNELMGVATELVTDKIVKECLETKILKHVEKKLTTAIQGNAIILQALQIDQKMETTIGKIGLYRWAHR